MLLDNYQRPLQQIFNHFSGNLKENNAVGWASLPTKTDEILSGSLKKDPVIANEHSECGNLHTTEREPLSGCLKVPNPRIFWSDMATKAQFTLANENETIYINKYLLCND